MTPPNPNTCLQQLTFKISIISYNKCKFIDYTGIPESWAVVGQDNQLCFSLTDHLLGLFVAQDVFSTLHHQLETRVDGLHGLFLNIDIHTKVSDSTQATSLA